MHRVRLVVLSGLTLLLVVALAACSSAAPKGSFKVTVNGLPSGVKGAVMVTGPGGYSQSVTSTTTLSVAPGTYSVTVGAASNANAIVPTMYDGSASSSSVAVTANATSSTTVSYAVRVGSGHLWVALFSGGNEAAAYPSGSLAASGSPAPDVTVGASSGEGEGVAFDRVGNMWVSDLGGYLYRYNAADLGSSSATAAVTINATAYGALSGLAFDASGDLWVANYGGSKVLEYTPSQLGSSGSPTPAVVLSATSGSLSSPFGLAFDAAGDLWVANDGNSTVVEFTPSKLASTGSPTPAVTISADATPSLSNPFGLAFDANGNLWVANLGTSVVRYNASQLASSGNPTPAATIASGSFGSSGGTTGLAFDASGNLWVASTYAQDLRRFTNPDGLSGSTTPTPDIVISSVPAADGMLIAFSPPPAHLPINTP